MVEETRERDSKPPSEAAEEVRELLQHFDKALRVFRLYDEKNDLVSRFVESTWQRTEQILNKRESLVLSIRPTSFQVDERSITGTGLDELALSLFRQGLVQLRLSPKFDEKELREFLRILARGLVSNDQSDDDLVTLLWRANFRGLRYSAVLSYHEEDDTETEASRADAVYEALEETLLEEATQVSRVAQETIARKQQLLRTAAAELPKELKEAVATLKTETVSGLLPRIINVVSAAFSSPEARAFYSADEIEQIVFRLIRQSAHNGDVPGLIDLGKALSNISHGDHPFAVALRRTLTSSMDQDTLVRLSAQLNSKGAGNGTAIADLVEVFEISNVALIEELIEKQENAQGRKALTRLLTRSQESDPNALVSRFRSLEGGAASEMLQALADVDIKLARSAVAVRLPSAPLETQESLMQAIDSIPDLYDHRIREALIRMVPKGGELRRMVLERCAENPDPELKHTMENWLDTEPIEKEWQPRELTAILSTLLSLHSDAALAFIVDILQRRSWFGRRRLSDLKIAAIRALPNAPKAEATLLLSEYVDANDKQLAGACMVALSEVERQVQQ